MHGTVLAPAPLRPALAVLAVALVAWVALFWTEAEAAIGIWITSTAYGHCFLIIPMALYLAWDQRAGLAGLAPRATPAWALLALPVAGVWLLAERLGIMEGRQLAAVAAFEVLCLAVLGWRLTRALAGPLLFLFFLVPFGAFFTPQLQAITARITEIGLTVLRIPHFVNDLVIEIPEGTFFVAEACAGLRFLIAAVAFGVFFALLNYRSPGRRVAFMIASVVIPIFANGLRALGIVALGHILGSAEAAAADHLIYGWVFFSIVMLLLVAAGMPFREAAAAPRAIAGPAPRGFAPALGGVAAMLALALAATGPVVAAGLNTRVTAPALAALPPLAWPAGCIATADDAPAPVIRRQVAQCGALSVVMTTQAFPVRARADAIGRERRARTGEDTAEDVSTRRLPGADPWISIATADPHQLSAVSTWIDGAPATGGLGGRIRQARNSVLGSPYAPLLITLTTALPARPSAAQQEQIEGVLAGIARAQSDLPAWVERATRVQ